MADDTLVVSVPGSQVPWREADPTLGGHVSGRPGQ